MPQFTSKWSIPFLTIIERPSIHGITGQIAAATESALARVDDAWRAGVTALAGTVETNRQISSATASATSDTEVGTAALDFGGASLTLPANVGAEVTTTFALECATWNGLSVFTGSLRVIRLSDGTAVRTEPRPVVWAPGIAVPRITLTTTYTVPAENFGRGLQLSGIKTNNNAAYRVLAGLTKITVTQLRTGTAT